jgi:hypothetical protein
VIGRCSSCGNQTEVNTIPVEDGSFRIACPACESGRFDQRILTIERFHMLVGRLRNHTLLEGERRTLRWNLLQMQKEANRRQRTLNALIREMR